MSSGELSHKTTLGAASLGQKANLELSEASLKFSIPAAAPRIPMKLPLWCIDLEGKLAALGRLTAVSQVNNVSVHSTSGELRAPEGEVASGQTEGKTRSQDF
ncbi:hypothetical protein P7K49_012543 [Saguinus oedipus]|uniref:Uncharacterized protein n=1 Tax=Saguinus oedipus TaxID=9490 RepID=A0ABQ9VTR1_SAGOE|nr:hypothetical protein P7K49_012543 [Saguinus oedipus]